MSRCVVVGDTARAETIAAALDRLDAGVEQMTGADAATIRQALERAGAGCELLILVAGAGDVPLAAAAHWARDRQAEDPDRPRPLVLLAPGAAGAVPAVAWETAGVAVCNRVTAAAVSGLAVDDPLAAEDAALAVVARGPAVAVVTLGAEGAVVARAGRATYLPPFTVEVVDPAGAGECFCAALGLGMVEGLDNFAATGYAMAAAAVAVGRPGAAAAMPTRDEVERMAHSVDLRRDPGTSPVEFPR